MPMPLYLDKLLAQLIYPLNAALLGVLFALLLLLLLGRRWLGRSIVVISLLWLWLMATPYVADRLKLSLEDPLRPLSEVALLPQAEAIVLLCGGIASEFSRAGYRHTDLGAALDRAWYAAELYRRQKAPMVIISGGTIPWEGMAESEAEAAARIVARLGVPETAIRLEQESMNTQENALYTQAILEALGIQRVLLVTSAYHMPRALATFQAKGIAAIPAPTDFTVRPKPNQALRWLPDVYALAESTTVIKELVGLWVYRLRGWAAP